MKACLREFGITISRALAVSLGACTVILAMQAAQKYLIGGDVPMAVWVIMGLTYIADIVNGALKVVNKDQTP